MCTSKNELLAVDEDLEFVKYSVRYIETEYVYLELNVETSIREKLPRVTSEKQSCTFSTHGETNMKSQWTVSHDAP
jgi:hypothetical protein